jgi:nucleotide-binding universal stress UspA family protein
MFQKILVPTDGSQKALEAVKLASAMAKVYDSEIVILSVFRHHSMMERSFSMAGIAKRTESLDETLSAYAKEIVEEGKAIARKEGVVKIKGIVRGGQVAKQILSYAKKSEIDLIVIGSQGQGDLSGYLLGGVSHKVVGLAKCPVLVV